MLFPYTYVPHDMEKMQKFIDFIFYHVWCKASKNKPFGLSLFSQNTELQEVMTEFYYSDAQGADFFYKNVELIYGSFTVLTSKQIRQLKKWYKVNNNLKMVCANDRKVDLARYADITRIINESLADKLGKFFKGLYSQSLLDLAKLRSKIGNIDDHYEKFIAINNKETCPFCGISDLLGEYHSKREAYDHYLPKAIYPFNSINFKNLVPACHHCNSSYKTSKDPAHTPKDPTGTIRRRTIFYPYAKKRYTIDLQVALQHTDIDHLKPGDITLQFGPPALNGEIDTWKDVYGIEERYKAKICGKNGGKYWLTQVMDEWTAVNGRKPSDFLNHLVIQEQKHPYADCNFLKRPFLEACKNRGLFNGM